MNSIQVLAEKVKAKLALDNPSINFSICTPDSHRKDNTTTIHCFIHLPADTVFINVDVSEKGRVKRYFPILCNRDKDPQIVWNNFMDNLFVKTLKGVIKADRSEKQNIILKKSKAEAFENLYDKEILSGV